MGVEYAERTVNLQSKDGDFLRLAAAHSPTGRSSVPVLSTPDGAHVLWESAEILHYLSGRDAAAAPPLPPLGSPAASAAGAKPPPSPRYHRDGSITQTAKGGATRTVPALHLAPDGARDAWALARASDADILIVDRAIRAVGNATAAFAPPAFGGDPAAALPMTAEREARVATAVAALDALEALLATTANAGPFFGGARVGVADCAAAPFLERWSRSGLIAEQIPALAPLTLREHGVGRWPQLARWYGALAAFRPYAARVEGDQLSYAQLAATFARVGLRAREASGGGSGGARAKGTVRERLLAALPRRAPRPPPPSPPPPLSAEQRARLEARAEAAEAAALKRLPTAAEARALLRVGREPPSASDAAGLRSSAAREVGLARGEALATLVANRERVCADALAGCGLIGGALADWDCADAATCAAEAEVLLRLVGSALATPAPGSPAALLNDAAGALGRELGKPLSEAACARAARLADFVAKRLCVPRDMGAPAGAQLRAALILAAAGLRG
jgi:glutathione S-transferase